MTFQRLRVSISCGIATQQHCSKSRQQCICCHACISHPVTNRKGIFSFRIPMKHIFGFCEDCDKIVYGLKHSLNLVRKTDDDVSFRAAAAGDGKVSLDKMSWLMPHLFRPMLKSFPFTRLLNRKLSYQ